MIERRRSTAHEGVVEVFLTTAGKRLKKPAASVPLCIFEKAGRSLRELVALRTELAALDRTPPRS